MGAITADEAGRGMRDKLRAYGDEYEEEGRAPVDAAGIATIATDPQPGEKKFAAPVPPVAEQLMRKVESAWRVA